MDSRKLALKEEGRALTVETEQCPHLISLSCDDPLATGIVIYSLHKGATVLGRAGADPPPDIALAGDGVSAVHCTIDYDEQDVVRLLPGEGEALVQGRLVSESVVLHQGQTIQLGEDNLFRFIHPAEVIAQECSRGPILDFLRRAHSFARFFFQAGALV
jgi:hypothetical protein